MVGVGEGFTLNPRELQSSSFASLLYFFVMGSKNNNNKNKKISFLKSRGLPPHSNPHRNHYLTGDTSKHTNRQRPSHSGEQDRQLVCRYRVADKWHSPALRQGGYVAQIEQALRVT